MFNLVPDSVKGLLFILLYPKGTVAAESLWRPSPPVLTAHYKIKLKKARWCKQHTEKLRSNIGDDFNGTVHCPH